MIGGSIIRGAMLLFIGYWNAGKKYTCPGPCQGCVMSVACLVGDSFLAVCVLLFAQEQSGRLTDADSTRSGPLFNVYDQANSLSLSLVCRMDESA